MFRSFVISVGHLRESGERRDDVGDFSVLIAKDPNWPVFCDDQERLRRYVESQGAGPVTLAAFDRLYEEYKKRMAERV